jgi:hypothetical protein
LTPKRALTPASSFCASNSKLHALRSRILRSGAENLATPRQPVRPQVVTHVLGTFCYPCLRAGHPTPWLRMQSDANLSPNQIPSMTEAIAVTPTSEPEFRTFRTLNKPSPPPLLPKSQIRSTNCTASTTLPWITIERFADRLKGRLDTGARDPTAGRPPLPAGSPAPVHPPTHGGRCGVGLRALPTVARRCARGPSPRFRLMASPLSSGWVGGRILILPRFPAVQSVTDSLTSLGVSAPFFTLPGGCSISLPPPSLPQTSHVSHIGGA